MVVPADVLIKQQGFFVQRQTDPHALYPHAEGNSCGTTWCHTSTTLTPHLPLYAALQGFASSAQPLNWSDLEPAFRSALLKLHFSDNLLTALPEGKGQQHTHGLA
jgi:hypothetical protein